MNKGRFQRRQGKYALTAERNEHGLYDLIVNPGSKHEYFAGYVADAENFETAVDAAEEEMRCLVADAIAEFG